MTNSSLGVVFRRLSCPLAFFYIPGLVHALLQSNNNRVAYIESFSRLVCMTYHQLPFQPLAIFLHLTVFDLSCWNKVRKFKVLLVLHVQIPIWKPHQTWVLQRYRWTYKTLFRRSLINRPIQNYRYHERILYVIQLSDRGYNVTFPA